VLLGGGDRNTNPNRGFRVTAGCDSGGPWGVEASALYIPARSTSRSVASSGESGSTDLLLPYIDVFTGRESATELSFQPIYRGTAREELGNSLLGAEVTGAWTVTGGPGGYFALPSNIGEHTRTVNTTQNVAWVGEPLLQPEGPAEPSFKLKSSDFWAHGLDVGLGFSF
jgi:hypothetical protein